MYSKIIGNKIKDGISLSVIGINEYAWHYESIVEIITILRENKIPILGGDVFIIKDGIIKTTCDSWYFKDKNSCNCEDSYDKAINYIQIFERKEEKYVYSIIV